MIAVMSPSGFIGRHLVTALLQRGHLVRGLARNPGAIPTEGHARFSIEQADFTTSADRLRELLKDASAVVHCAGHYQADQVELDHYVRNVGNLSRSARQAGLRHFILLSSMAVYGGSAKGQVRVDDRPAPDSAYGRSRLDAEAQAVKVLGGSDVRLTIARVPAVVGRGMHGRMLTRFFGTLRYGLFLHPGPADAFLPCIGVHRLAASLALMAGTEIPGLADVIHLSDRIAWTELAKAYGQRTRGHAPIRIAVPVSLVKALSNTTGYEDHSSTLERIEALPGTWQDIEAVIEDHARLA